MGKTVRLRFSPYTYARVAVMKSNLLRKDDYNRLLKMGYNEILRKLEETGYKKEMDEFDVSSKDIMVIESALNANMVRTFMKLYEISNESMKEVISMYLRRYDMDNLKMIIRSKFAKVDEKSIEPLLYDSVNYSKEFFVNLSKKERVSDIINTFSSLRKLNLNTDSLFELENQLDRAQLEQLYDFAHNLRGQGRVVAGFLKEQLDMLNVRAVLRLRKDEKSKDEIIKYLIKPSKLVLAVLEKESIEEIVQYLHRNKRTQLQGMEKDLFARLELDLEKYLLKKVLLQMHKHLLSANYILAYLLAKEVEVSNLKAIIKGKRFNLDHEFIEKLLVIAS